MEKVNLSVNACLEQACKYTTSKQGLSSNSEFIYKTKI